MDLGGYSIFVSGFPRSGTSMMMRMLYLGGVPILWSEDDTTQGRSTPFDPNGVYEFKEVGKELVEHDAVWTVNHAIKLLSIYVRGWLPLDRPLKIIFMLRGQTEIITSMLAKRLLIDADVAKNVHQTLSYIEDYGIPLLKINYREAISYPKTTAMRVADFLEADLDLDAMKSAVERKEKTKERRKESGLLSMNVEDYNKNIELGVNVDLETMKKLKEGGDLRVSGYTT